ncbi:MAG: peptide-methionine (S)-S-oxide reductase MsrA [Rhodospirillales bacterium]|jgi:peptide-methionine (S)-S-oxide reductase|nr:peptide-methionine (S)-S-oxide reductase MsrA [Rhodospirillales bacterium]
MVRVIAAIVIGVVLSVAGRHAAAAELKTLTVAGGCFWCVESDFDQVPGVVSTVSGYTGGTLADPTYEQVSRGGTGHREAVQITYDAERIGSDALLDIFWRTVDPTDARGQFCDRGEPYQTAIFVEDEAQRRAAEASRLAAEKVLGKRIVTPIEAAGPFYPAEDYHQDYYTKNPVKYRYYRWNCGRDQRVKTLWGAEAYRGVGGHD